MPQQKTKTNNFPEGQSSPPSCVDWALCMWFSVHARVFPHRWWLPTVVVGGGAHPKKRAPAWPRRFAFDLAHVLLRILARHMQTRSNLATRGVNLERSASATSTRGNWNNMFAVRAVDHTRKQRMWNQPSRRERPNVNLGMHPFRLRDATVAVLRTI